MENMGKIAYDAHREHLGEPAPAWEDLEPNQQAAWDTAAQAVYDFAAGPSTWTRDHLKEETDG